MERFENGGTDLRRGLIGAAAIWLLGTGAAFASACTGPEESKAVSLRALQTELMVAALKCSHKPELAAQYNSFVRSFGRELAENGKVLMAAFKRTYPKDHQKRFDSFITRLANDASQKSLSSPDYCETTPQLFDSVLGLKGTEVVAFASTAINGHAAQPLPRCN
jgi:hypothetical protein